MPVRNLPNTVKVWEAVQGDVRHGAGPGKVGSRVIDFLENSRQTKLDTAAMFYRVTGVIG